MKSVFFTFTKVFIHTTIINAFTEVLKVNNFASDEIQTHKYDQ